MKLLSNSVDGGFDNDDLGNDDLGNDEFDTGDLVSGDLVSGDLDDGAEAGCSGPAGPETGKLSCCPMTPGLGGPSHDLVLMICAGTPDHSRMVGSPEMPRAA